MKKTCVKLIIPILIAAVAVSLCSCTFVGSDGREITAWKPKNDQQQTQTGTEAEDKEAVQITAIEPEVVKPPKNTPQATAEPTKPAVNGTGNTPAQTGSNTQGSGAVTTPVPTASAVTTPTPTPVSENKQEEDFPSNPDNGSDDDGNKELDTTVFGNDTEIVLIG